MYCLPDKAICGQELRARLEKDGQHVTERDEADARWRQENAKLVLYPESPIPLFAQVARAIRRRIAHWELPVGALMPSEPTFAELSGMSRETIRRAYWFLRETGTIKSRRGVGWFVADELPLIYVTPAPGSKVYTRPRWPGDVDATPKPQVMLEASSLIIEEPGKPPHAYDPMRTIVVMPD